MSIGYLHIFFEVESLQVPCPFFKLDFVCLFVFGVKLHNSLKILDINLLTEANMLPHSVSHLFIVLMVSFAEKLFSLIWSHFFIFSFISPAQGDIEEKILL